VNAVPDHAIMIHGGRRIDDDIGPDDGADIDDGSGHENAPLSQEDIQTQGGAPVDEGDQPSSIGSRDSEPGCIVPDRDEAAV
jgi:hypothetical protein